MPIRRLDQRVLRCMVRNRGKRPTRLIAEDLGIFRSWVHKMRQ